MLVWTLRWLNGRRRSLTCQPQSASFFGIRWIDVYMGLRSDDVRYWSMCFAPKSSPSFRSFRRLDSPTFQLVLEAQGTQQTAKGIWGNTWGNTTRQELATSKWWCLQKLMLNPDSDPHPFHGHVDVGTLRYLHPLGVRLRVDWKRCHFPTRNGKGSMWLSSSG